MTATSSLSLAQKAPKTNKAEGETNTANQTSPGEPKVIPDREMNKDQITNSRLAAEAGSMNRLSLRASLGYAGGSILKPFDRYRPNYRGLPNGPLLETGIGGSIGGAYRFDEESSLRFGVGATMRTPFHNTWREIQTNHRQNSDNPQVFNVSTPSLEYNKTFRTGNIMLSPSVSYAHATDSYDTDVAGFLGWASLGTDVIFEIEGSKWMPGFSIWATQSLYRDGANTFDILDGQGGVAQARRSNLEVGVFPYVEYQFNDTFAYRALFGFFNFNNYRDQYLARGEFFRDGNYISTGIGISPNRDIWIYPNVQFNPNNIRGDLTNVGLSTVINL